MFRNLLVGISIVPVVAMGSWSQFVHVTPRTMAEYKVQVCVTSAYGESQIAKVSLENLQIGRQIVWLIIAEEYIPPERQHFRNQLWEWKADYSSFHSVSKVQIKSEKAPDGHEVRMAQAFLNRDVMSRSYLYIDYATEVDDGGYFYIYRCQLRLQSYFVPRNDQRFIRIKELWD